jgi:plasmid stabilization system protein ParE
VRRYRVNRAANVTHDLDLIEGYLVQVYLDLGDDLESAVERAACRIDEAQAYMRTFEEHPYCGTKHVEIRSDIRTVTNKKFIFYLEIDEPLSEVRILAVFFGGVDHGQQILDRLRH